jgi:hypothetical protein
MSFNVTNEEYIELVEGILEELRPDQPVRCEIVEITDRRTKRKSQKLAIALDVERGPQTQVIFNFNDVLGLGELPLRSFLTSKLTSIGVHPVAVRERAGAKITDEVKTEPTAAEAAKLRELIAKRRQPAVAPAVKKAEAQAEANQGGFFGATEVTEDNVPSAQEAQDIIVGEEDFS